MSKYIDLDLEIAKASRISPRSLAHDWQREALTWLDEHPDQVPGRTITESEYLQCIRKVGAFNEAGFDDALKVAGIFVVANPVPSNAEKLRSILDRMGVTDIDDISTELDEAGVKAPDHD